MNRVSDFSSLDLLGALGANVGMTHLAMKRPDMRLGFGFKNGLSIGKYQLSQPNEVPAMLDLRFLSGVGAAVVAQFGGPMTSRVGYGVANAMLNSFVATETVRKHAENAYKKIVAKNDPAAVDTMKKAAELTDSEIDDRLLARAQARAAKVAAGTKNEDLGW